ncbi:MAG: cation:proton antiporter regulatory subunit [Actinomycetales bacterium]|nr:cation:proton antiporter regulatory subunit [Actinomycetales bacterium]
MEFVETLLPGVGVRYDATTTSGAPLSLVLGRDGEAELVTYKRTDPDAVAQRLRLTPTEAASLAELLGSPRVSARLADLSKEVPGLSSARFVIEPGSRYDGRRLGDSKARTRTGCSVVAVVRGEDVRAAPGPQADLRAGDTVVAIGSERGLADLGVILAMSPEDEPFPVPELPH